jgi:hypothetical protein
MRQYRFVPKIASPSVWENQLKERFGMLFLQRALHDPLSNIQYLPVARFVSTLYELNIVNKERWPVARIIEDMHQRGYAKDVFTKPSYGAEAPSPLSLDECHKWLAYYRVVTLNET